MYDLLKPLSKLDLTGIVLIKFKKKRSALLQTLNHLSFVIVVLIILTLT